MLAQTPQDMSRNCLLLQGRVPKMSNEQFFPLSAIIIAHTPDGVSDGKTNKAVHNIAEYLKDVGF